MQGEVEQFISRLVGLQISQVSNVKLTGVIWCIYSMLFLCSCMKYDGGILSPCCLCCIPLTFRTSAHVFVLSAGAVCPVTVINEFVLEVGAAIREVRWGAPRLGFHVNEILDLRQDKDNSNAFPSFSFLSLPFILLPSPSLSCAALPPLFPSSCLTHVLCLWTGVLSQF